MKTETALPNPWRPVAYHAGTPELENLLRDNHVRIAWEKRMIQLPAIWHIHWVDEDLQPHYTLLPDGETVPMVTCIEVPGVKVEVPDLNSFSITETH